MDVPSETIQKRLISRDFSAMRGQRFLYAHKIGDALAKELEEYHANANDVTDLSSELAILRSQVGEALQRYEASQLVQPNPELGVTYAVIQQGIIAAQIELNMAIVRVQEMAVAMSKIQSSRNGKIDTIVLQTIVTNLAQQVDAAIQEFASNQNADNLSERITNLVGNMFDAVSTGSGSNSLGAGTGPVVATIPSRRTAEELLEAMASTVPREPEQELEDTDLDISNDEPTELEGPEEISEVNQVTEVTPITITPITSIPIAG